MDRQATIDLYASVMDEIRRRGDALNYLGSGGFAGLPSIIAAEVCYLQLRLTCELIAIACLVAHGDIEGSRTGRMQKAYEADWTMNNLERLHPEFYPKPTKQIKDAAGKVTRTEDITTGFLTKNDLIKLYHECASFLHRGTLKSVLSDKVREPNFDAINRRFGQIVTLLNHHQIQLIDPDLQLWALMKGEDGKSHAWIFGKAPRP